MRFWCASSTKYFFLSTSGLFRNDLNLSLRTKLIINTFSSLQQFTPVIKLWLQCAETQGQGQIPLYCKKTKNKPKPKKSMLTLNNKPKFLHFIMVEDNEGK